MSDDDRATTHRDARTTGGRVARPGLAGRGRRGLARTVRLRATPGELVIEGVAGGPRRIHVGPDGHDRAVWTDTAGHDVDHGVDPLIVQLGGHVDIPDTAGNLDGGARLTVLDWLPDPDLLVTLDPVNPLEASGLAAVLDAAGFHVDVELRPTERPPAGPDPLVVAEPWPGPSATFAAHVLLSIGGAVAALLGMGLGGLAGRAATVVAAIAAFAVAGSLAVAQARDVLADRVGLWTATTELRPRPGAPTSAGFRRQARLAVVGDELVLVNRYGAELWLGRESGTGAAQLAFVTGADGPVRVELRRADGTTLARLPWSDWCGGDGGTALRSFAAGIDLPCVDDVWRPDRRAMGAGLSPSEPTFGGRPGALAPLRPADLDTGKPTIVPVVLGSFATMDAVLSDHGPRWAAVPAVGAVLIGIGMPAVSYWRRRRDERAVPS